MSRFRALMPLLIVVMLVVIVLTVMRGRGSTSGATYAYQGGANSFVSQLNSGQVSAVLVNTTAQTVRVTPTTGHGLHHQLS